MTTSPYLGVPQLAQAQAFPEITFNEAFVLVQAILNGVKDKDLSAPPGSPAEGDAYIIAAAPTGAWSGRENAIAIYWGGSWRFVPGNTSAGSPIVPGTNNEGLTVFVRDENAAYTFRNTGASPLTFEWLKLGTTIDAVDVIATPSGNLAGTNVQAQLNELDTEKAGLDLANTFTANQIIQRSGVTAAFSVTSDGAGATITQNRYSTNGSGVSFNQRKSRGSLATPTIVSNADLVNQIVGFGHSGVGFVEVANLTSVVSEPTPSTTAMGAQWRFALNPAGSVTTTEVFRLDHTNGFQMFGANPVIDANRLFRRRVYTVGTLPAAGTQGRTAFVSDANAPVWGAAVAGGGAVGVPVYDTGAAWFVG